MHAHNDYTDMIVSQFIAVNFGIYGAFSVCLLYCIVIAEQDSLTENPLYGSLISYCNGTIQYSTS